MFETRNKPDKKRFGTEEIWPNNAYDIREVFYLGRRLVRVYCKYYEYLKFDSVRVLVGKVMGFFFVDGTAGG